MEVDLHADESQSSDVGRDADVDSAAAAGTGNKEAANLLETVAVWLTQYIQVRHSFFVLGFVSKVASEVAFQVSYLTDKLYFWGIGIAQR